MNTNGRQSYTSKIDRLIDEHERILQALKLTRDLLGEKTRQKKQHGANGALTAALAHEAHEATRKPAMRKAARQRGYMLKIRRQRERSLALLAEFDVNEPRPTNVIVASAPSSVVAISNAKATATSGPPRNMWCGHERR